jgi:hypothetical protein
VFNCNPPPELGQTCEPQGSRWRDGRLYLTTRHRGILVYDPQTKELKTLVYTYLNQLFKGPNDLDFDAEVCSSPILGERVLDRTWPIVRAQSTSTRMTAPCTR